MALQQKLFEDRMAQMQKQNETLQRQNAEMQKKLVETADEARSAKKLAKAAPRLTDNEVKKMKALAKKEEGEQVLMCEGMNRRK